MTKEQEKMPCLFIVSRRLPETETIRVIANSEEGAIVKAHNSEDSEWERSDYESSKDYEIESSELCFESLRWMFRDSFLKPEIIGPIDCAEIQKHGESVFVPLEYVTPEMREGAEVYTFSGRYLARLSARGFLDCTDWLMYDDLESAIAGLAEMYDSDVTGQTERD